MDESRKSSDGLSEFEVDRRRFLKVLGALGVGVGATGLLDACGGSAPPAVASPAATGVSSATPAVSARASAGPDMDAARREGLVYWSPTDLTVVTPYLNEFTKVTGIKAVAEDINPGQALPKITQALKAGKAPPVDVFTTSDVGLMDGLRTDGTLMEYRSPQASDYDAPYKSAPDGYWTAVYVNVLPLMWRKDKLAADRAPKSYLDMLDPRFKGGRIGVQNTAAGTSYAFWYNLKDKLPSSFFDDLASQKPRPYSSTTQMLTDLNTGTIDVGIFSIIQYGRNAATIPLGYSASPGGTAGNIVVTSILRTAEHPNAAKAFVDYLLSRDGQQAWANVQGAYSPRKDVTTPNLPPLSTLTPLIATNVPDYASNENKKRFTQVWNKVTGAS